MLIGKIPAIEFFATAVEQHDVQVVYAGFIGPGSFGFGANLYIVGIGNGKADIEHHRGSVGKTFCPRYGSFLFPETGNRQKHQQCSCYAG